MDFEIKYDTLIKYNGKDKTVKIPNEVRKIEEKAFEGKNVEKLILPNNIQLSLSAIYDIKNLKEIEVPDIFYCAIGSSSFFVKAKTKNGIVYSEDEKTLIYCPSNVNKEIILPNEITKIEEFAFVNNKNKNKLILNENLKEIGMYAFFHSNINTIVFKNNIDNIYFKTRCFYKMHDTIFDMYNTDLIELTNNKFNIEKCDNIKIILPKNVETIEMPINTIFKIIELKNYDKIKEFLDFFGYKIEKASIDELLERNKTFREINKIISNQER